MKKLFITFLTTILMGGRLLACDYTVLSGTQASSLTLSASTKYLLRGCYTLASGVTLTIPAGTQLFGENSTGGRLIVGQGAKLIAIGTSSNPIIFTSDQPSGSRAPGDWKGVTLAGNATGNKDLTLNTSCDAQISAGGSNDADSSGVMEYVQILYGGGATAGDDEVNGLTLAGIGSKTVIDHVQVAYSLNDGIAFLGGTVNSKFLISQDNNGAGFTFKYGSRSKLQFIADLRDDLTAHTSSGVQSNGIYAINDATGSTNTPITHPIISNASIIGPGYCGTTTVSSDFKNGIMVALNANTNVYNSFIGGWPTGYFIKDAATIQRANNTGTLLFFDNSFYNDISSDNGNSPSWSTGGCTSNMTNWLNYGSSSTGCNMGDNEQLGAGPGYSSTICNSSYCGMGNRPSFVLSSNDMQSPDFTLTEINTSFYDKTVTYRGAFGTSPDWTLSWANLCPEGTVYCEGMRPGKANQGGIQFVPNPSDATTYALFTSDAVGKVTISVLDKVNGKALRTIDARISEPGDQKIAFSVSGLQAGVYMVKIQTLTVTMNGQIMVK